MKTLRKTKIVCTLGPATNSAPAIEALITAGMDVVRLNFSHGTREEHRATIRLVRQIAHKLGRQVAILQDLCGPKIRLGVLPDAGVTIHRGDTVTLTGAPAPGGDALPVSYPYLAEDVHPGDPILLADGLVALTVTGMEGNLVRCRVEMGGTLSSHKGVNLPGSNLRIPAVTDKDRLDLAIGLEEGVDFVALSFVRTEEDLDPALKILDTVSHRPMVIAKIEKPEAVHRLDAILARVDGVMVARGDLGVELPVEQVPLIQKKIIRAAVLAAKPVITATQMLRSMVSSPRPTRAEASDVANAILDGTDAVMLSEESAVGQFPVEAVATLDRIARAVEPAIDVERFLIRHPGQSLREVPEAIGHAACWLARDVGATTIVASTASGATARLVARFRPAVPVIGLTPDEHVERQLCLSWGVIPARCPQYDTADAMIDVARTWLLDNRMARRGDTFILTAGLPVNVRGTTNMVKAVTIEPEK
ncbi:MAG: pyruvate kinase [Acidobacteria bacterium]|nr:pyruvate kinase [Acidobacteriota bacterium]